MQHIETVTVGSGGSASITFSAIPADYTDLVVVFSGRSSRTPSEDLVTIYFNSSTTGYSTRNLYTVTPTVYSESAANSRFPYGFTSIADTANTFSNCQFYIPNYRSSVAKSFSFDSVTENNATAANQTIAAGLWSGTDPITEIELLAQNGTIQEFSSFTLYGITAGSDGIVAVS